MADYLILQRQCAHYRVPLFQRLFTEQGWRLVCAQNFLQNSGGKTSDIQPFMQPETYIFPRKKDAYLCHPPIVKILRQKPKILVAEAGTKMSSTYLLALFARFWPGRQTRVVFWGHGAPVAFARKAWQQKLGNMVKRWLIQSVDAYLCYTTADKTYLQSIGVQKPVFVANNTIDIQPMLQHRNLTAHQQNTGPYVLAVGRQTPDKNFAMLMRIFQAFQQQVPAAQLVLVGAGPAHANLQAQAGAALGQSIHMPGAVYDEAELARYFNQADIFITCGAVGLGVNHAIAYGVPVLCYAQTAVGPFHHPEICYVEAGVTGWQVPTFTEEAMLQQLLVLFGQPQSPRAQLAATLPAYAAQNLSLDNMVAAFGEIQEKMA